MTFTVKTLSGIGIALLLLTRSVVASVEPKLLYEHDPTLLVSTIQVVVLTGSQDDPDSKHGLSNMMGELMLRGTKKRGRDAFQSEIERLGATLHVRTSHDMTVFVGRVIKENTFPFLKLLEEALVKPAFPEAELKSLKKEVLAEISHLKNNNNRLAGLAVRKTLFAGSALERPNEGTLTTAGAVNLEDITKMYNDHFSRGNFVFAVSSPLPENDIKKAVAATWKQFPEGGKRIRRSFPLNTPKMPTLVVVHKPKTSTGAMMFGQGGLTAQDPNRYKLMVGNFAFGSEPLVARLFKVIRAELGWTYYIGSTYYATGAPSQQQGFFVVSGTPSVEFTAKAIFKVLSMFRTYVDAGLKGEEIRLAQDSLVNSYPFEFESPEKRLWQRLYSYLYSVPMLSPDEYSKTIYGISNKDIKSALKEKQDPNGWLIAVVADKDVIAKQLEEEQKDVPKDKRLMISKVLLPEDLIK